MRGWADDRRRAQRDQHLTVLIRTAFTSSRQRYGSPRIHADLREQDERCPRTPAERTRNKLPAESAYRQTSDCVVAIIQIRLERTEPTC